MQLTATLLITTVSILKYPRSAEAFVTYNLS